MRLISFKEAPLGSYGWYDDVGNVRHYFIKIDVDVMRLWGLPDKDGNSRSGQAMDVPVNTADAIMVWVQGTVEKDEDLE